MAATRLRLLLDESITEPLATRIMDMVQSTVHVRDYSEVRGMADEIVAAFAVRERRLLVAVDGDFKKKTHVSTGVIKLRKHRHDDDCLFAIFKAFWTSGYRTRSRSKRAFLTHEGFRIENGQAFERRWKSNPCPNRARSSRL